MTPQQAVERALREQFIQATRSLQFNTIDEIVQQLDAHGFFTAALTSRSLDSYKKVIARQFLRSLQRDDGVKVFRSVLTRDDAGSKVRMYKQEELFSLGDYQQTVEYHREQADHHMAEAVGLVNRAFARYHVSIQLDFTFPSHLQIAK